MDPRGVRGLCKYGQAQTYVARVISSPTVESLVFALALNNLQRM